MVPKIHSRLRFAPELTVKCKLNRGTLHGERPRGGACLDLRGVVKPLDPPRRSFHPLFDGTAHQPPVTPLTSSFPPFRPVPNDSVFSGELKDDRPPSGNLGAAAAAASSSSSAPSARQKIEPGGGGSSTEDSSPMWLRDYKSGMEYEVYSLALDVAEGSCLWGLTFSRWGGGRTVTILWFSARALCCDGW